MSERKNKKDSVVQERLQILLSRMLQDEDNKYCVDCDSKGDDYFKFFITYLFIDTLRPLFIPHTTQN